ncbi:Cell division protein FtsB [Sanguibacter gelidistatuariae]|uniref:Cell division protein FtsB n=2 Tax=Sanguibacter gelidistatuariae TaxID=1814289 RepID=A0A1G6QDT9_9MICO|nr:Cell division protein FtsB [Sanguibacter gelidistatuariae]
MRIFTVRAAVLLLVTLMGFILIMPTALQYGKQRTANQLLSAQLDASLVKNADLENERNRWKDPKYVISQARGRLTFVFPGETPYRVIDPDSVVEVPAADAHEPITDGAVTTGLTSSQPWYSTIWESVQIAGNAT